MKIVAVVGLLFWFYCLMQVLAERQFYGNVQLGCWTIILIAGLGWCLWTLDVIRFQSSGPAARPSESLHTPLPSPLCTYSQPQTLHRPAPMPV